MQKLTESQIEQAICQWLHFKGWFVFKLKDNTAYRDGAHRKPLPFQINGVPDLHAMRSGVALWIEVKTKTGTQSKAQKEFQSKITAQGGIYWIVRSLEELKSLLGEIKAL